MEVTTDASGAPVTTATRIVHGPGIDEALLIETGGQGLAVYADGLGSVTGLTDAPQPLVEERHYTAFGVMQRTGSWPSAVYAYTGREWEPELGLYDYRARYYDPEVGRFSSRDPIRFRSADRNLYNYVFGDPTNLNDPTGLYGTGSCMYYLQACQANGGFYECEIAPRVCSRFPDGDTGPGNVSSCMRQCLQERHYNRMPYKNACSLANNISPVDNVKDHRDCAVDCMMNPENPYDPLGLPLPDGDPRLWE